MRIGCLGLVGLVIIAAFFLQLAANSAKSVLAVAPVAAGIWIFLYLQKQKEEEEEEEDWD